VIVFAALGLVSAVLGGASLIPRTISKGGVSVRTDGGCLLDLLRAPPFAIPEPPDGWLRGSGEH